MGTAPTMWTRTTWPPSAAANGADTTIEVLSADAGRAPRDDLNPTLENVLGETQASMGAPSNYYYSNGVLTFEVPDLSAGTSVSVRLILADGAMPDTLWALHADDAWTDTLEAGFDGNEVALTLTDGGPGDSDGEANGRIVAALGAATALPPLPELELTITKQTNSHTLSWPLPYTNAFLEFSTDLTADSWSPIDFLNPEISEDHWQITLPNPIIELQLDLPEDPGGYYRLRHRE